MPRSHRSDPAVMPVVPHALVPRVRQYEDVAVSGCAAARRRLTSSRIEPDHMAAPVLSDIEIQRALGRLPGWSRRTIVISKQFTMATFPEAIAFVQRIATAAEAAQHHPDIDIRYTKVLIALSTHDSGGLTQKDIDLAGEIERLAEG